MSGTGFTISESVDLRDRNTLRVSARARFWIDADAMPTLPAILALPILRNLPLTVLGAGSNVLFRDDYPGAILHLRAADVRVLDDQADSVLVDVDAGKNWHAFVMESLQSGWFGLENLALIPGTVGAAPIQNIGAYGVEVGSCITSVTAFDRKASAFVEIPQADCRFAYRDSLFKQHPDRYIVTVVRFRLSRDQQARIDYPGLRELLARPDSPSGLEVADAVITLRKRKLPDPDVLPNAGSFFKNPVVEQAQLAQLRQQYPDLPSWPSGAQVKLSAAWLIERAGLKGARIGDAGIAAQHALVLVNHGQASGHDLMAMAELVQNRVSAIFGITLAREPVLI